MQKGFAYQNAEVGLSQQPQARGEHQGHTIRGDGRWPCKTPPSTPRRRIRSAPNPPYAMAPQYFATSHARSSSASSPPTQAMNDNPAGQPATVPTGMLICGSPASTDAQPSRMTRTRNNSASSAVMSMRGAMQGAVGS